MRAIATSLAVAALAVFIGAVPARSQDLPARWKGFPETEHTRLAAVWGSYERKHGGGVTGVAFSPDGKLLVTTGNDWALRLWDVATGKEVRTLAEKGAGPAVAFSPDGRRVASGLAIFDVATGAAVALPEEARSSALAFSRDGARLATGHYESLRLFDATTAVLVRTVPVPPLRSVTKSLAFSPDDKLLLAGGDADDAGSAQLFDVETGELVAAFGPEDTESSAALLPDGKRVVAGGVHHLAVYEVPSGRKLRDLGPPGPDHPYRTYGVDALAVSPDGMLVLTGEKWGAVRLWDTETGKVVRTLRGHPWSVPAVAFSPDGKLAASGSMDHTVRLWDVATGDEVRPVPGNPAAVFSLAVSPDGRRVLSGGDKRALRLWDAATGRQIAALDGHEDAVRAVAFSGDSKQAISASDDGTVRVFAAEDGAFLRVLKPKRGLGGSPLAVGAFGEGIAVFVWREKKLALHLAETGERIRALDIAADGDAAPLAVSADRKLALVGSYRGPTRFVDLVTGEERRRLEPRAAFAVALSPDGTRALTAGEDYRVRLVDLATGQEIDRVDLSPLAQALEQPRALAFLPDGRGFLVGTWRGVVLRFDLKAK